METKNKIIMAYTDCVLMMYENGDISMNVKDKYLLMFKESIVKGQDITKITKAINYIDENIKKN